MRAARTTRVLLWAGMVPLPWFLLWTALGACTASGYSSLARPARELSLLPGAPSMMLGIGAVGSGVALCLFAEALRRLSRPGVPWGPVAWAIYGASMVSNGCWPMTDPRHGLYGVGLVSVVAPALSAIALADGRLPTLLRQVTGPVSFALVAYWWAGTLELEPEAYRGLTQRLFFAVRTVWPMVAAITLLGTAGRD